MEPDEPLSRPAACRQIPAVLDDMSQKDLEDHIAALEAEIVRTRAHLAARGGQRAQAEQLFRSGPLSRQTENAP
ncbi:DUF1192 domain-containing protein [Pararhodospirillum oryzae]|uniref:DUF1192 domain-containing protein n=1 Tax=Pararhodospirillum oryzae TaxID=478448 RepID=A0A512H9N9_9PROT|nr:DUF1192 domain-containing protein [Pararhodospirillum oryzae]GEO82090.1 hypothetical protein ROR02_22210 [Pararhodospirillum oryzae]